MLTEIDEEESVDANRYLDRAGLADLAGFECGDGFPQLAAEQASFDIVLLDHEKTVRRGI